MSDKNHPFDDYGFKNDQIVNSTYTSNVLSKRLRLEVKL